MSPLDQRPDEPLVQYRGLLLYAIQMQGKRSLRLTADVLGKGNTTVRKWRQRREWDARLADAGDMADVEALRRYTALLRSEYGADYRCEALAALGLHDERLRAPIPPLGENPDPAWDKKGGRNRPIPRRQRTEGQRNRVASDTLANIREGLEPKKGAPARPRAPTLDDIQAKHLTAETIDKHLQLIDAGLAYVARAMTPPQPKRDRQGKIVYGKDGTPEVELPKLGHIKPSLGDIPRLLKARALLTGLPTHRVEVGTTYQGGVESVRVQQARASGDAQEVLTALEQDAREALSIVEQLRGVDEMREVNAGQVIDLTEHQGA